VVTARRGAARHIARAGAGAILAGMRNRLAAVAAVLSLVVPTPATAAPPQARVDGYAEWVSGETMVVDGQRVRLAPDGRFRGEGDARTPATVPLGYEVSARGTRLPDGTILADTVAAQPNGSALFEKQVLALTDEAEAGYRRAGAYYQESSRGRGRKTIGRLRERGPEVERVRAVLDRLLPPYLDPGRVRVYVIENPEWNAFAMGNYSIYVFSGLLADLDDDELAVVLGHELAHATHEHTRRQFKKQMWVQIAALGAAVAAGEIEDGKKRAFAQILAAFTFLAWRNGYGRDLEDQADRVGLRYAYEGGFDVMRGPHLWKRFARKYGEPGKVASFFFANHSRSSARARNLEREVALNYPSAASGVRTARGAPGRPAAGGARAGSVPPPPKEAAALVAPARASSPLTRVQQGMDAEEVRALVGPPAREVVFGARTHWTYPDGTVVLEHGKVAEVRF
jgi:Zn-dependent protease with chaperone function